MWAVRSRLRERSPHSGRWDNTRKAGPQPSRAPASLEWLSSRLLYPVRRGGRNKRSTEVRVRNANATGVRAAGIRLRERNCFEPLEAKLRADLNRARIGAIAETSGKSEQ